jgi:hypothetical protein
MDSRPVITSTSFNHQLSIATPRQIGVNKHTTIIIVLMRKNLKFWSALRRAFSHLKKGVWAVTMPILFKVRKWQKALISTN